MTSAYILLLAWIPAQDHALSYHDERAREALTAAIADMEPKDHLQELARLREKRTTSPPTTSASPADHQHADLEPAKETYAEAKDRSIREGKPFLVWVGEGVCPACIQNNKNEFVSWVDPDGNFDGLKHGLVIGMPEAGKSIKIAEITDWTSGHIPTVRRAIRRWDESRTTTFHSRDSWSGTDGKGGSNMTVGTGPAMWTESPRITGPTPFRVVVPAPVMRPIMRSAPMSFRSMGRSSRGCST